MIIRDYEKSDYNALIQLLFDVYNSEISQETLETNYITSKRKIFVAVDEQGVLCGCTFVEIQEDFVRPNKVAYVTYVAVSEKYRKQGIGKKLLEAIENLCKEKDCSSIELTSADYRIGAHAFYNSIGFSKKKTTIFIKEV